MQNKRRFEQYHRYGLLFIAPFFLAFFVFQLYPILYTIYLSFTDLKGWNPAANLVGLDNYFAIFRNPLFLKSISMNISSIIYEYSSFLQVSMFIN